MNDPQAPRGREDDVRACEREVFVSRLAAEVGSRRPWSLWEPDKVRALRFAYMIDVLKRRQAWIRFCDRRGYDPENPLSMPDFDEDWIPGPMPGADAEARGEWGLDHQRFSPGYAPERWRCGLVTVRYREFKGWEVFDKAGLLRSPHPLESPVEAMQDALPSLDTDLSEEKLREAIRDAYCGPRWIRERVRGE